MPSFGPIYCETPTIEFLSFPAEPVNTWTNGPTILLGLIALYLVWRRAPRAWALYVLGFLIFATGVGSTLWHGFRTPLFLSLDVLPGILAFFLIVFLWPTYLFHRYAGYAATLGVVGVIFLATRLIDVAQSFTPFLIPIVSAAILCATLTFFTFRRFGSLGWYGVVSFILAGSAAIFRTLDLSTCAALSFGTHFLWHILLGAGAFCVLMLFLSTERKKLSI